ncbi:hypothetical protein [Phaeobacter italicus]|uniref:hypothetical protein n=1 Tax=Phaeobacter italicus TaxID=481446 RepID=UPI001C957833|nr:hypothetical protein [Phaeobacter italicus]MBY6043627.1 hypothetical protein [Phaeobacter italicus]
MEYRHNVDPANPSGSNLASGPMGFTATVGGGSLEVTSGHGMTRSGGVEHTVRPTADPSTGLTFSTEAGLPVPGGNPRPHDLVEIGGIKVKVAQAVRDGLIMDPSRGLLNAPESGHNAAPQVTPHAAPEGAVEAPESVADSFTNDVLPRVSPSTISSIEADLNEGQFSEKTMDYLMLEGGQSAEALSAVRDAYAAKVTAATGMDEAELQELWQDNRPAFNAAISEMLKTGSTAAFQDLAAQADAAAWTAMSTDEATDAWKSQDFPQALLDAGLEPSFEGGVVSIKIPGMGVVPWTEAVQRGLVKVSRHG